MNTNPCSTTGAKASPLKTHFVDFETVGFSGLAVLLQYATEEGKINIHNIFYSSLRETLEKIEYLFSKESRIVGFNLTFDYFHAIKVYNLFKKLIELGIDEEEWFEDIWLEQPDIILMAEESAFLSPYALKPGATMDLMLFARSTSLQKCMNRSNIVIRRMPSELASAVSDSLNEDLDLPSILFATRKQNKEQRFVPVPILDDDGNPDPDFSEVTLRFSPSTSLKAIAKYLGIQREGRQTFEEVANEAEVHIEGIGMVRWKDILPKGEKEYVPFNSVYEKGKGWLEMYKYHAEYWMDTKQEAYAEDDIHETRGIYNHFLENEDEWGKMDWDSVDNHLVSLVANTRYRGFKVDVDMIKALREKAESVIQNSKMNFSSPSVCRRYLLHHCDETMAMILTDPVTGKMSTNGDNLKAVAKEMLCDTCDDCWGEGCSNCGDKGIIYKTEKVEVEGRLVDMPIKHPAAKAAQEILDYRHMKKEIELYDKVLVKGRIFPDVNIVGAKSSRMSGKGGFNFQGVKSAKYVRSCFVLKDEHENLGIGDLDAFEISIMEAVYCDPNLRADLLSGKKIHGLFAQALFPHLSYEEVLATKDLPSELNLYGKGKASLFCLLYGGSENKIADTAGVDIEVAKNAFVLFGDKYPKWREKYNATIEKFSALDQKGSAGSKIESQEHADYAETLFGFKRYFDIDYQIIEKLSALAQNPPKYWKQLAGGKTVIRRDREQSAVGATRSSLFAAAFGLQSAIIRQAQNHEIQGSGAYVTKVIQKELWEMQPPGIHPLRIRAIQIHDEVIAVSDKELTEEVSSIVDKTVKSFESVIPLIAMSWDKEAESWAESH